VSVQLATVPHEQQHLVVIGSAVRKGAATVAAWLQGLSWQVCPRNVQRFYLFIDDGLDADTRALLDQFVAERGGLVWDSPAKGQPDFRDDGWTHEWTESAMGRVGALKDRIFQFGLANRAEAVFLVDADLILDPMTLTSLWSVPEAIVSACFWTRWFKDPPEGPPVHAGPQVWLHHPYQLHGMGMEEWEFRDRLINRQITEVAGLGACTLFRQSALAKGVCFAKWPGNNLPGIGQGEDRHLSMRAQALHVKMYCDPWADLFHIYHPEDVALIPEMQSRLQGHTLVKSYLNGEPNTARPPNLGDLISVELTALETIPTHTGPMRAPTRFVRGRLGKVGLVPELEDAVLSMERGEVRVVPVHFPLSYPFAPYRGQRRIIRLTLHDHKPHGFAPVIETELITNRIGSAIDTVTCPPELLEDMKEVHA
jgi:hypothetical protein